MKLIGYIKPYKQNSFTIPIYSDGKKVYHHILDDEFCICSFSEVVDDDWIIKKRFNDKFKEGDQGALMFSGNKKIIYNKNLKIAFVEICKYLEKLKKPKLYLFEEIFDQAKDLNIDLEQYSIKLQLRILLQNKFNITNLSVISLVEKESILYLKARSRKSSFKSWNKLQIRRKLFFKKEMANTDKIENYKEYIISNVLNKNYSKAINELEELIIYQIKVSPLKFLIKSLTNISSSLLSLNENSFAKLVIMIAKLTPIEDAILDTQYAEVLKSEGDLQGAKKLYEEIQRFYPNDIVAKTGYAEVLKLEGDLQGAKKLYEEIQLLYPNDIFAKTGYAGVLKSEGDLQGAKKLYKEIQLLYPNDIFAKTGYAEVLKLEGDLQGAKKLYEEIQLLYPNDIFAKTGYAEVLKSEGDLKGAKKLYEEIQLLYPNNIFAKTGYAEALKSEGNLQGAKRLYEEIQQLYPNNIVVKNGYAGILKSEGNLQGAKKLYEEIQQLYPNDLYSKHALLNCNLILKQNIKFDLSMFQKLKTVSDYYFYHSWILYHIREERKEKAYNLILEVISDVPYFKIKKVYESTLKFLKILNNDLSKEMVPINEINIVDPIDNILNTHILSEIGLKENALKFFNEIKKYPRNSIVFESACLLSELYSLNGLPKKGYTRDKINEILINTEVKALAICI
ncbi:tetratricopeptide repeat protein [uncultured Kordia sp.]|uniref:tetratricopeptide repeat protein n=1 Tax=uncultured Kordia sp. TaxID=507699 RepID=UPI002639B35E|nr:tetratricopeptide repeat protein [uncultured Kordia sp.]